MREWANCKFWKKFPPWCILFDYSPAIRYKKLQGNTEVLRIAYTGQITFIVSMEKKLQELIIMEKKLQNIYPTDYD